MLNLSDDLNKSSDLIDVYNFDVTYQVVIEICAKKFAPVHISRIFCFDRVEVFPKMPETSPLANRSLVVNPLDASHEFIIELCDSHSNSAFRRATNIPP